MGIGGVHGVSGSVSVLWAGTSYVLCLERRLCRGMRIDAALDPGKRQKVAADEGPQRPALSSPARPDYKKRIQELQRFQDERETFM